MPNRDDVLRLKTFKDGGVDLDTRIYYTLSLSGDRTLQEESKDKVNIHRTTRAVAAVMAHLHAKGLLSEEEIDEILLGLLG